MLKPWHRERIPRLLLQVMFAMLMVCNAYAGRLLLKTLQDHENHIEFAGGATSVMLASNRSTPKLTCSGEFEAAEFTCSKSEAALCAENAALKAKLNSTEAEFAEQKVTLAAMQTQINGLTATIDGIKNYVDFPSPSPPPPPPPSPASPCADFSIEQYVALGDDYIFATLSGQPVNGNQNKCQNFDLAIPLGWELAPDDDDALDLARAYTFNTQVLVVSNGNAYTTTGMAPAGVLWNTGGSCLLPGNGDKIYKTCTCGAQILVRAPASCGRR